MRTALPHLLPPADIRRPMFRDSFSLIETLVAITVIAILAALSLSAMKKVQMAADRSTCVSIMHQFGMATSQFVADNDGRLPGPVTANGQTPYYGRPTFRNLFGPLTSYLGGQETNAALPLPDNLVCPAYRKRYPDWKSDGIGQKYNAYLMNQDQQIITQAGVTDGAPFVWGNQSGTTPARLSALTAGIYPLSQIIFLTDGSPNEKANPVHGSARNYLYMDFHVESLDTSSSAALYTTLQLK